MKPVFVDIDGYRRWKHQWRALYLQLSTTILRNKHKVKAAQRIGEAGKLQKQLRYQQVMAYKLHGLLNEARARWQRIMIMKKDIAEQMASFPLILEDCRTVDFHYNRGANEFAFLPMWVVKTKGKSFYVHHITADCPWTTRETPEGSTRGMLRFRNCSVSISPEGEAMIKNDIK